MVADDDMETLRKLEGLTETLLREVAERDVEIELQAERHVHELHEAGASSRSERAWLSMPVWVRALVGLALGASVFLVR
jgi:type VI protein secretion system component VasF